MGILNDAEDVAEQVENSGYTITFADVLHTGTLGGTKRNEPVQGNLRVRNAQ
jgi:hypothetical protein